MPNHRVALVWFRRDLRLTDNPALRYAVAEAAQVIPVFIHAPDEEAPWSDGAASRWWLHNSLTALTQTLQLLGSRLVIRSGSSADVLQQLCRETNATLVSWNRLYEPAALARDKHVSSALQDQGIAADSHNAALLFEPWAIRNKQQQPYRVFTAYWRTASSEIEQLPSPQPAPKRINGPGTWPTSEALATLKLQPAIRWDVGLAAHWTPGESGALKLLKYFGSHLAKYPELRDRPDTGGTSRLSPHLHFGELGPRQILAALARHRAVSATARAYDTYSRQLGWREFAHHLLFYFPDTPQEPLDKRFAALAWKRDKKMLGAWQRGRTGYPIVDAGLRELWHTGWMHNRVRMIVASFLTKNLQMHWVMGARWFWDTLVDADLANNTLGWQWTAGCGADAAPYYRIFNPVLQTERFDPTRAYLRKWLPEIAALPNQWIHQPWNAPSEILAKAGIVLGKTYPKPLVDLATSRDAALAAYDKIRR